MFQNIMAAIANAVAPILGDDGKLTGFNWMAAAKGVVDGRPFFLLPLYIREETRIGSRGKTTTHECPSLVTFFQREVGNDDLWVWDRCQGHVSPVPDGALHNPDNGTLEDLFERVLSGERNVPLIYEKGLGGSRHAAFISILPPGDIELLAKVSQEADKLTDILMEALSNLGAPNYAEHPSSLWDKRIKKDKMN